MICPRMSLHSKLVPVQYREYEYGLLDKQFGRSLIYNRNSSGPRIVPWGTAQVNEQLLDNDPLWSTFVFDSLSMTLSALATKNKLLFFFGFQNYVK